MGSIKDKTRNYILEELCNKNEVDHIDDSTSLISSGIIDSVSTLHLVDFIEKEFKIEFKAHEVDRDNLDTLDLIEKFIELKRG